MNLRKRSQNNNRNLPILGENTSLDNNRKISIKKTDNVQEFINQCETGES